MRAWVRHRGSVLLMVIGLLTVIAMLGSMLLLVARIDRQTSQAIAAAAPEDQVAQGLLDRLLGNRVADLYISPTGGPYSNLDTTDPLKAERQMVDYPSDRSNGITTIDPDKWFDDALASIETYNPGTGNIWRHVSHLPGTTLVRASQPNDALKAIDVPTGDPDLVDTDGDGNNDSLLFATGVRDSNGDEFYAAVRMIDASGLLNVNIAGTEVDAGGSPPMQRVADINRIMDPSYLALEVLLPTSADAVLLARNNDGSFDMGDMLALNWLHPTPDPNTANGRLRTVADTTEFLAARPSLTVISTAGTISPLWRLYWPALGSLKADPNNLWYAPTDPNFRRTAYDAFLAMLQVCGDPNAVTKAGQLTANLIDYLDSDPNDPNESWATRFNPSTDLGAPGYENANYYGLERHPYVSKVFRKLTFVDPNVVETAAIELINPYANPIDLTNYFVNGAQLKDKYIPAGTAGTPAVPGRFVIYSDPNVQIDPKVDPNSKIQLSVITKDPVYITWKHPTASPGWEIRIDETEGINLTDPNAAEPNHWNAKFRDDRLEEGRYTLPVYRTDPNERSNAFDYADPNGPKMGQENPVRPNPAGDPVRVYIRNGRMICLGDLMRLFLVGPTETESFTKALKARIDANEVYQLLPSGAVPLAEHVPLGCLTSEFFNLLTPEVAGSDVFHPGLVNINTAPAAVLRSMPSIRPLNALAQGVIDEVIAYRDRTRVGSSSDYTPNRSAAGIANLRSQPGFATASEVAIPLWMTAVINPYTTGTGPDPPWSYKVADAPPYTDDGLCPWVNTLRDDPVRLNVFYTWLSNQVTVRSNTFVVYISVGRVPTGQTPSPAMLERRYVALIDRGHCRQPTDRPKVLMFAELR